MHGVVVQAVAKLLYAKMNVGYSIPIRENIVYDLLCGCEFRYDTGYIHNAAVVFDKKKFIQY